MKDPFEDIVGQEAAKSILGNALRTYNATGVLKPTLLVSPKGNGKTSLATALAKQLKCPTNPAKIKPFIEIECESLKSTGQFMTQFAVNKIMGKEVTVFFDEAHEIPKDLSTALLRILNTQNTVNNYLHNGYSIEFDFRKISWIFATTEIQCVFPPLVDRLEQIDLEDYSVDELCSIVKKGASPCLITKEAMEGLSTSLRGNGRQAFRLGSKAKDFLADKNRRVFESKDWEEMKKELYLRPMGLSPLEVKILEILDECGDCSLTCLAAKTRMSRSALQRTIELYLLDRNLMKIAQSGRAITIKGKEILKEIRGA